MQFVGKKHIDYPVAVRTVFSTHPECAAFVTGTLRHELIPAVL
jgi:hypothetical protein